MNYLRDLKDNFSFILNKNGMPSFIYQPKIVVKKFKQNRKEIEDYFTREYAKNYLDNCENNLINLNYFVQ